MKNIFLAGAALAALSVSGAAYASATPGFSPFGADLGPGVVITLNANGTVSITNTGEGPYDSVEDTYIGVINNTLASISSIHVTSTSTDDGGAFAFDGDGLGVSPYNAGTNASDTSYGKYGGPNAYFTNIVTVNSPFSQSGDVNFINGIAGNGGTGFFSLEGPVTASDFASAPITVVTGGVPEPTAWAMMITGFFGLGAVLRRRRATAVCA